jgi:integrase
LVLPYRFIHVSPFWVKRRALLLQHPAWDEVSPRVFLAPETMEPLVSDQAPDRVWRKALRKLGIPYRTAYNIRHTFATLHLMAGLNPALIVKHLVNSIIMVTTTYAKWITSEQVLRVLSRVDSGQTTAETLHRNILRNNM